MCGAPGNMSTTFTAKRHARVSEPQLPVGHAQQLTGEHGHQLHRWPTSLDGEKEEGKEPLFISIVRYECIYLAGGQCLEVRTALGNKTQIWDNMTRNGPNRKMGADQTSLEPLLWTYVLSGHQNTSLLFVEMSTLFEGANLKQ